MNIASYARTFFLFGGALLIAIAVLQMLLRPRPRGNKGSSPALGPIIVRATFFALVGVAAILVGVGAIPFGPGR
jgi:hypothetical protein